MESDGQMVDRVLKGDRGAFAPLVDRYQHAVFAIALKILEDREAAEDATQSALVAAYSNLHRLHDGKAFGAWLLVIARREAMSLSRTRRRTVPLEDNHTMSCPDGLIENETLAALMTALGELAVQEQQVLMLRYFESHSMAAIAAITGRSMGTVTKQISRALRRLRKEVDHD